MREAHYTFRIAAHEKPTVRIAKQAIREAVDGAGTETVRDALIEWAKAMLDERG